MKKADPNDDDEGVGPLVFHEPWWLRAASNDRYEEVTVSSGGSIVGRLPFVRSRVLGMTLIKMPSYTHILGPTLDAGTGKPQTRMLKRLSIVRELLDQLPSFHHFKQAMPARTAEGLAFQDRSFRLTPQYTFKMDCRRDLSQLWQDMHFKTRQHIRRAEEKFATKIVRDADAFVRFYHDNLAKAGVRNRVDFSCFGNVFEEVSARGCGEIVSACWSDGTPAAMVFLVWGRETMYYLLSTRARDAGDNGSVSLLIWSAMRRAHELGLRFDLDGVSTSGTARFLGGFGGELSMRFIVQRSHPLYGATRLAKRWVIGGVGEETRSFT